VYRDEELPKTIAHGQYTLQNRLGQGGMAAVYRAQVDLESFDYALVVSGHETVTGETEDERAEQRKVRYELWRKKSRAQLTKVCSEFNLPYPKDGLAAVKVMIPQEREDAVLRFEAEWRQLLAINHPHLIKVFGGGYEDNVPWYAMEIVENILPVEKIRKLPELAKLDVIFQAASGLCALHERDIIHRDVKPANLLCCKDGERIHVRVMDLGIAKMAASGQGLTLSHHVMGTPYYMSPEQAGSSKRVDARADIYSLGAALYSLVTGRRPYDGKSMYEIVGHLVRGEGPEPPMEVNPELHKDIAVLIERMMALDADRRLQTMERVREVIQLIFEGDSENARKLLAPKVVPRKVKKRSASRASASSSRHRVSTGGSSSNRLSSQRKRRQQQGSPPKKANIPLPLLIGGVLLCLLLVGGIVYAVSGGSTPEPEFDPVPVTQKQKQKQPPDKPQPLPEIKPKKQDLPTKRVPHKDMLARIDRWGNAMLLEIEGGSFGKVADTITKMWDLAYDDKKLSPHYLNWKRRLAQAQISYCDKLAQEALQLARAGRRGAARLMLEQLQQLNPVHGSLAELRKLVENRLDTLQVIIDGKPRMLKMTYKSVKVSAALQGQQLTVVSKDGRSAAINVGFYVPQRGEYRVELDLRQTVGSPHFHHKMVGGQNSCMKLRPTAARQKRSYELRIMPWQQGRVTLVFGFPETGARYEFGPLKITRLYSDSQPLNRTKLAQLRKARNYVAAHALMQNHADVMKTSALRILVGRMGRLSKFQQAVARGQRQLARQILPLTKISATQAIDLCRAAVPQDQGGSRTAMEAAYLWEVGDKRAKEYAKRAMAMGARVGDLLEEIKKGVRH